MEFLIGSGWLGALSKPHSIFPVDVALKINQRVSVGELFVGRDDIHSQIVVAKRVFELDIRGIWDGICVTFQGHLKVVHIPVGTWLSHGDNLLPSLIGLAVLNRTAVDLATFGTGGCRVPYNVSMNESTKMCAIYVFFCRRRAFACKSQGTLASKRSYG